jgi:hypothetical protein
MADPISTRVLFDGGVNTVIEDVLTPSGKLSTSQNTRQRHPGITQRGGHRNIYRDAAPSGAADEVWRIHQYIDRNTTKHFLAQYGDGTIDKADEDPPTAITGFTTKLAAPTSVTSLHPASFAKVDDALIISDGERQHQIFSGETAKLMGFIVYKGVQEITTPLYTGTTGLNDISSGGTYTGTDSKPRYYKVQIDTTGTPDQFDWWYSDDNRATWTVGAGNVAITGSAQTLDNGVQITFAATTGHTSGDTWYLEAHAIDVVPENGEDYTFNVNDERADTFAELDSLDTLANHDALFICTEIPASKLNFTFITGSTNDNASVMSVHYWKDTSGSYGWTAVSGLSDGTDVSGDTMKQDGSVTWTASPTSEVPHYMFGRNGYWYRLTFSAALDSDVQVEECSYESTYQAIDNIWDGVFNTPAEVMQERAGDDVQKMYKRIQSPASINMSKFPSGDYIYVHSLDRLVGFYIDPGLTPNVLSAKATGLQTIDGGANEDILKSLGEVFGREGFAAGMTVTTAGFSSDASNNFSAVIRSVSNSQMNFPTGTNSSDETDTDATVTFSQNAFIEDVEFWDGNSWTSVSNLVDGTRGMSQHGFVTWQRNSAQKSQFKQSALHIYVYRLKMNSDILPNINISLETLPYFDMDELPFGVSNGAWKQRAVYSNGNQNIYITAKGRPMVLNGSDFAVMEAGDGRSNEVVALRPFYNELIAWQIEDADSGGCTTLFEGFSPQTFGKVILSTRIGCLNAKSAAIIDGATAFVTNRDNQQTMAIWLSRYGVYMTDGRVVTSISEPIRNYFNPAQSECININKRERMWLEYDSGERVIRIGLVTGSNTNVDTFPVLDLLSMTWSFDTYPSTNEPGCFTEVVPDTGTNTPLIQITGGATDASIKQSNYQKNDVDETNTDIAIECLADVEFDGEGGIVALERLYLREKAQDGNTTVRIKESTNTSAIAKRSLPRNARQKGDQHHRSEFTQLGQQSDHITVRFENKELNSSMYLLDALFITEIKDGHSR